MPEPSGRSAAAAVSKTTYRPFAKLEKFYTGGAVCLTTDESAIICACGDEVKVSFQGWDMACTPVLWLTVATERPPEGL